MDCVMSVRETFENACVVSSEVRHPVVLRFKGVHAHALARIVFHDARTGGDLSHVDADQSGHNKRLYGSASWAQDLKAEIAEIKLSNHENAIAALECLTSAAIGPLRKYLHFTSRQGETPRVITGAEQTEVFEIF